MHEAGKDQVRDPGIRSLHSSQWLDEVIFKQMAEVIFHGEFDLPMGPWRGESEIVRLLGEVPVVKGAEPGCCSALQEAMRAALRLHPPTSELIGTRRDDDSGDDLKGRYQYLSVGVVVE